MFHRLLVGLGEPYIYQNLVWITICGLFFLEVDPAVKKPLKPYPKLSQHDSRVSLPLKSDYFRERKFCGNTSAGSFDLFPWKFPYFRSVYAVDIDIGCYFLQYEYIWCRRCRVWCVPGNLHNWAGCITRWWWRGG